MRRGDGRVPEGDALYRGGVIVSVRDVAMGVMSAVNQIALLDWLPVLSRPINSR